MWNWSFWKNHLTFPSCSGTQLHTSIFHPVIDSPGAIFAKYFNRSAYFTGSKVYWITLHSVRKPSPILCWMPIKIAPGHNYILLNTGYNGSLAPEFYWILVLVTPYLIFCWIFCLLWWPRGDCGDSPGIIPTVLVCPPGSIFCYIFPCSTVAAPPPGQIFCWIFLLSCFPLAQYFAWYSPLPWLLPWPSILLSVHLGHPPCSGPARLNKNLTGNSTFSAPLTQYPVGYSDVLTVPWPNVLLGICHVLADHLNKFLLNILPVLAATLAQ